MDSNNLLAIDIETACASEGCKDFGKSICREDHSLMPDHSQITVVGVYGRVDGKEVKATFRDLSALDNFIRGLDPVVSFIGHNAKFDLLHLHVKGVSIDLARWVGDTQLAAYVLTEKVPDSWLEAYNEERKKHKGQRQGTKHSLKVLAPYFLGVAPFWETEEHSEDSYVLKDCEYTFKLHSVLERHLRERREFDFFNKKQLPWAKLLLRAEMRGLKLDMDALCEMEQELTKKEAELRHELDQQWHQAHVAYTEIKIQDIKQSYKTEKGAANAIARLEPGVDYESPKQMLWLLRDYYGYDCTSLEGTEGTGREILERLADGGHNDVTKFLEWRKTKKILSAFLPSYQSLQVGGTIRPVYNPDATSTGRTSSRLPNLQQVPPSLRRLFVPRPGYTFVGLDSGAIEAKLIALYTSDPQLYNVISSGVSLHDYNTKVFFGLGPDVPLSDIKTKYALERATTKNVGFGCFYGAGANRIRITFAQKGFHLSDYECREILERFRSTYDKAVEVGMEYVRAMEAGEVIPNLLGRPIKIQDPERAYMTAFNALIQSSASDLNLEAARRTQEAYDKMGLDAHVVGFVHDFVMVEAADEVVEQAEQLLIQNMTGFDLNNDLGPIKLTVEGGQMRCWEK